MVAKCASHAGAITAHNFNSAAGREAFERIGEALTFFREWQPIHAAKTRVLVDELTQRRPDGCRNSAKWFLGQQSSLRRALANTERAFTLVEAGDETRVERMVDRLLDYTDEVNQDVHLRHRWLYAIADQVVPSESDERLVQRFEKIQTAAMDRVRWTRFERLAEQAADAETRIIIGDRERTSGGPRWAGPPGALEARTLSNEIEATPGDEMNTDLLFDRRGHQVVRLTEGGDRIAVEANQYLLISDGEGMVLDPGGPKIFPNVVVESRSRLHSGDLRYVFMSHQDPDVLTSLNAWMIDTDAEILISKLWYRFVPHFGIENLIAERMTSIPDEGTWLKLGSTEVAIVPAHFLHSCGNFQVYDPVSKTLFSGDLGASVGAPYESVTDFEDHTKYMLEFHRRYMASGEAVSRWAKMARELEIERVAPQHGAVFEGQEMVHQLIDWISKLECGLDLMKESYKLPPRPE